jgi:hypothetical protein
VLAAWLLPTPRSSPVSGDAPAADRSYGADRDEP